jgi:hypothetical protein
MTKTMMMALSAAALALTAGVAEAKGGHGGHGGKGGFHGGGFGHHGGFRHHGHRYRHFGWGHPAGGYYLSSYGGYGCDVVFSHARGRFVRVCY